MSAKEKYNLQRLLEMRERARDEAAIFTAECRRQLTLAENELNNRKQAVEDCRRAQRKMQIQMTDKSSGGIKSTEIVRYRQHLADLRQRESILLDSVKEQITIVRRSEQTVEKALDKLSEAAKETRIIEKHRENWQQSKKLEGNRREQKSNDEIGAILYGRQELD